MILNLIRRTVVTTTTLSLVLSLAPTYAAQAQTPAPANEPITTFWEWLTGPGANPDANEPPRTKRGGGEFCLVALNAAGQNEADSVVTNLWNDYPEFTVQGELRRLELYSENSPDPLWTSDLSEASTIPYNGPRLQAGETYTLRAEHPQFPTDFETYQLTLLPLEERILIAFDLLDLGAAMRADGQSTETIALARADYFWQRDLPVDAWAEVVALQITSDTVSEVLETAYDRVCD